MGAIVDGSRKTARIIEILARNFRDTMYGGEILVSLEYELKIVEDFFAIQKYRFGDRLTYEIYCETDLKSLQVPRFTIQPLVENSIYHGMEEAKKDIHITINIIYENGGAVIEVKDNGAGIGSERLDKLNSLLTAETSPATGSLALRNIYQRLRLLYSDSFSFHIYSTLGVGTSIRITLPQKEEQFVQNIAGR
jgi:two-component system sensor histidine kinase YesM